MQGLMGAFGVRTGYELAWVGIGLGGQLLFMLRFIVQWIVSERARRSVIPVSFWWFSIAGAAILLAYAIHRRDPVFILGQSLGFFVYARNLWLIRAEHGPGRARPRWRPVRRPARRSGRGTSRPG
jgi:lipid-A-disaccharide synthase-like uncharacterized protein